MHWQAGPMLKDSDSYLEPGIRSLSFDWRVPKPPKRMRDYMACLVYSMMTKGQSWIDRGKEELRGEMPRTSDQSPHRKAAALGARWCSRNSQTQELSGQSATVRKEASERATAQTVDRLKQSSGHSIWHVGSRDGSASGFQNPESAARGMPGRKRGDESPHLVPCVIEGGEFKAGPWRRSASSSNIRLAKTCHRG